MLPSIEWPLVYDFVPNKNFLSTLLFFAISVGTKLYVPYTYVKTTVRIIVTPTTIFFEKVKIRGLVVVTMKLSSF